MKRALILAGAVMAVGMVAGGCDSSPPPPRVVVPAEGTLGPPRYDPAKPLPGQVPTEQVPQYAPPQPQYVPPAPPPPMAGGGNDPRIAAPPAGQVVRTLPAPLPAPGSFDDQPLVRDRPPEQRAFVEAYNRVGRPRIAVYVNRRLDGTLVLPQDGEDGTPAARTTLPAERVAVVGPGGDPRSGVSASVTPGQYDEAFARSLDYQAVEAVLTDWLAAGGQTEVISPTLARARLTAEQVQALERGERFVLADVTQRLDADVLVQVQMRPTRQTTKGLEMRIVAEAINARGGRSVGRAVVDVPPPLEKTQINEYTRFLARKLMDDMTGAWNTAGSVAPAQAPAVPAPPVVAPSTLPSGG